MMRLDVVADHCRCDETALEAELTQRVLEQLVLPDPSPACSAVPSVPSRWLAAKRPSSSTRHLMRENASFSIPTASTAHLQLKSLVP
jgi:hypothetical protein